MKPWAWTAVNVLILIVVGVLGAAGFWHRPAAPKPPAPAVTGVCVTTLSGDYVGWGNGDSIVTGVFTPTDSGGVISCAAGNFVPISPQSYHGA